MFRSSFDKIYIDINDDYVKIKVSKYIYIYIYIDNFSYYLILLSIFNIYNKINK